MGNMIKVNEIFYSIQGESSFSGAPFIFIRLSGCNLRCSYCDTSYSYEEGDEMLIESILDRISAYPVKNVEITGGEPLLQEGSVTLMDVLIKNGYRVFLETNGSADISGVPADVIKIVDVKCPDSGEERSFDFNNIDRLTGRDEVKFVISSKNDYEYAKNVIKKYRLTDICNVIISTVSGRLSIRDAAEWLLSDGIDARLQIQLHKYIFGDTRGV